MPGRGGHLQMSVQELQRGLCSDRKWDSPPLGSLLVVPDLPWELRVQM